MQRIVQPFEVSFTQVAKLKKPETSFAVCSER
jgi:hypothetical protein